jgi:hypothetical protein
VAEVLAASAVQAGRVRFLGISELSLRLLNFSTVCGNITYMCAKHMAMAAPMLMQMPCMM